MNTCKRQFRGYPQLPLAQATELLQIDERQWRGVVQSTDAAVQTQSVVTSCVTLPRFLNLSVCHLSHPHTGNNNSTQFTELYEIK